MATQCVMIDINTNKVTSANHSLIPRLTVHAVWKNTSEGIVFWRQGKRESDITGFMVLYKL